MVRKIPTPYKCPRCLENGEEAYLEKEKRRLGFRWKYIPWYGVEFYDCPKCGTTFSGGQLEEERGKASESKA
jgi:DNA-directed RNA polymerase subunit RPC12/RpoP